MPRPRNNAPHGSCWPSNGSRLGPTESNTGSPCATNRRATESNARSRGDSSTESRSAGGTMIHTMVVPAATAGCGPSAGVHSRTSKRAPRNASAAAARSLPSAEGRRIPRAPACTKTATGGLPTLSARSADAMACSPRNRRSKEMDPPLAPATNCHAGTVATPDGPMMMAQSPAASAAPTSAPHNLGSRSRPSCATRNSRASALNSAGAPVSHAASAAESTRCAARSARARAAAANSSLQCLRLAAIAAAARASSGNGRASEALRNCSMERSNARF